MEKSVRTGGTYATIKMKANKFIEHDRHFRVTFWAMLANFSGLALGVHYALRFFISYLNSFEI